MAVRIPWEPHVRFPQEDEALLSLLSQEECPKWATIAERLNEIHGINDKSGKQCRERWLNHLNPEINKMSWTEEEEQILFFYQELLGNKWSYISKYIPGRPESAIKNHFYSSVRQGIRKYNRYARDCRLIEKFTEILHYPSLVKLLIQQSKETSTGPTMTSSGIQEQL